MLTVKGVYRDGKVKLLERPPAVAGKKAEVLITFLETAKVAPPKRGKMIRRGMYKGLIEPTEEDFKAAKTAWKKKFDDLNG
jgi:hypothetical protein